MNYRLVTIYLFLLSLLLLVGCSDPSSSTATLEPTSTVPADQVEQNIANPSLVAEQLGSAPNAPFSVKGTGFPENEVIVFYFAESEANLGPSVAQVVSSGKGDFGVDLLLPTAWPGANFEGQSRLLVVAESIDGDAIASDQITIDYSDALVRFENPSAGYMVDIPKTWTSTEVQITPLGELILLGPDPITPGNPGNSVIISANYADLDERAAAQSLTCGTPGCTDDIQVEITTVNGLDARRVTIGQDNNPRLDWYFIRYDDRLIYFTLHDPLTLVSLDGLVQTFTLTERRIESSPTQEVATVTEPTEFPPTATSIPTKVEETVELTPEEIPTETLEPTQTPTIAPSATPASTATATQLSTDIPTETVAPTQTEAPTETVEPTETPTIVPTNTVAPTDTPRSEPTETATSTPTITPAPAATDTPAPEAPEESSVDSPTVGPLQTSLDLFTILSRSEETTETLSYFAQEELEEIGTPNGILAYLQLEGRPFSFQAERIQGVSPPIVRVSLQISSDAPTEVRDLTMVNLIGRWQISEVTIVEPE